MKTTLEWRERENMPPPRAACSILSLFSSTRERTRQLCQPLETEDFVIQAHPDVSPVKWHLAHTTWFFEEFVLKAFDDNFKSVHPSFSFLFNSYYQSVGKFHRRGERGFLSRPTLREVWDYRLAIDTQIETLLDGGSPKVKERIQLGIAHEEQHQELLLMDVKYNFAQNPLRPIYQSRESQLSRFRPLSWIASSGGAIDIGASSGAFSYDNEKPRHGVVVRPFEIADRLITNAEFLEFIRSNGYQTPALWLSDGWDWVEREKIMAPLYWFKKEAQWWEMTLGGAYPLDSHAPVSHVSYFEADAFARWAGARLVSEAEWESVACHEPVEGNFLDAGGLQPKGAKVHHNQFYGDVWEWTKSPYLGYPGFVPEVGAIGEYNGKFMCNQMVMRGGSCLSPQRHLRASYRNFFYPHMRWQCGGIRLAKDAK